MKLLRLLFCFLLLATALTGCAKVKALFVGKPTPAPSPTPAQADKAPPVAATSKPPPRADNSGSVAVLCYHRFENGSGEMILPTQIFAAEMQKIKDAGLSVISMKDFLAWRRGEKSIPPRSILITLDDGWISGYTEAWPILKKFGYPFTMFIYTDYVKGGPKSGGKSMTWEQLEQMRDEGVDIEGHTTTHSDLRAARHKMGEPQYLAFLQNELGASKDLIEQKLAIKISAVAYPYGNYNEIIENMVKQLGYEAAFTVNPQKITYGSPAVALGRYAIDTKNLKSFDNAIDFGAGSSGPSSNETAPMAAASMLTKPADGETLHNPKPLIEANLQALGKFDPASVVVLLSGFGPVPATYDGTTGLVKYQVTAKLAPKTYTVIVHAKTPEGKIVGTRWNFSIEGEGPTPAASPLPSAKPKL